MEAPNIKRMDPNLNNNYSQGISAFDAVVFSAIVETSDGIVTNFMKSLRSLSGSTATLAEPCFMFSPSQFSFGEYSDLRELVPDELREFLAFPAWVGFTGSHVSDLLLREEAETFRSLMHVAIAMCAVEEYGIDPEREQLLFEKINEFAAVAYDKINLEALA